MTMPPLAREVLVGASLLMLNLVAPALMDSLDGRSIV
jgi:hypothetical protein